jgi:hypothetical protein
MFQFESLTKRDWALVLVFTVALALILVGAFYWAFHRAHSVGPPTKAAGSRPIGDRETQIAICQFMSPLGGERFLARVQHREMPPPRNGNRRPGNARDRRCGANRFQSSPAWLRLAAFQGFS